jgi:hypothetical protein
VPDAERIYTLLRSAGRDLRLPIEVDPSEHKSLVWEIGVNRSKMAPGRKFLRPPGAIPCQVDAIMINSLLKGWRMRPCGSTIKAANRGRAR